MAHEDKYDYYRVKAEYVKPLFDKYISLKEVMFADIVKTAAEIGAVGTFKTKGFGATKIGGFVFAKDCKFDFKFSSEKLGDEVMIKPYRNSKLGRAFAAKMEAKIARLNDTYKNQISMGDWLIHKFDCYRDVFKGAYLLTSWAGCDSKKQLIVFKIPKTETPFVPPKEFEEITYGQVFDLINS